MNIFYRPQYVSDATRFLEALKAGNPGLTERQRQGRSLLWDKTVDREASAEFKQARVAQQPYVYQCASSKAPV